MQMASTENLLESSLLNSSLESPTPFLKKLYFISGILLFSSTLLVPSLGTHGLLNPKSLLLICTTLLFILKTACFGFSAPPITYGILFLGSGCAFFFTFLGMNEFLFSSVAFSEALLFLSSMLTFFLGIEMVCSSPKMRLKLIKACLISNGIYLFLKALLFLVLRAYEMENFLPSSIFGIKIVTMAITEGFFRLQTSLDLSTPFLLLPFFLLLEKDPFYKKYLPFYLPLSFLGTLLSFSRFLIIVWIFSLLAGIFSLSKELKRKIFFLFLCTLPLLIVYTPFEKISKMVEVRLFSSDNTASDLVRNEQIRYLQEWIETSPLIGWGFGGYTPLCIRDEGQVYSYEVQWVAWWMQTGILGVFFLIFALLSPFFPFLMHRNFPTKALLMLVFFWALSSLTNPFLLSLTSATILLVLWATLEWHTKISLQQAPPQNQLTGAKSGKKEN